MRQQYNIPILKRSLRVIEALVEEEEGLSSVKLERRLGIPKTTIFRIMHTLQYENWVEKHGNRYLAGYRMIQSGLIALSKIEIKKVPLPYLDQLSKETGETSHLGVLSGDHLLIAEVCDGPKHIRISSRPGTIITPHCSSLGKVVLAFAVGDRLEEFFKGRNLEKRTPNTIIDMGRLKEEMVKIRQQGYAVDNMEYYEDVRCLAAPIRNALGDVIAGVGITATVMSFKKSMISSVAAKVVTIANAISRDLGAS